MLAEKAAWDFVKREKPSFTLTRFVCLLAIIFLLVDKQYPDSISSYSINPAFILGHNSSPSLGWGSATSSYAFTTSLVDAPAYTTHPVGVSHINAESLTSLTSKNTVPSQLFVDVVDVARSHVAAFTTPAAAGKRYALVAGAFTNEELGRLASEAVPEQAHRFPPQPEQPPKIEARLTFDAGEAEKDFGFKCEQAVYQSNEREG